MAEAALDYAAILEEMQARREVLMRVIQGLDTAIDGLSQLATGDVVTAPQTSTATGSLAAPVVVTPRGGPQIQSDTFFRMSIGEAAKKLLEITGQPPRSLTFITDALNRGGLKCKAGSVATVVGREAKARGLVKVGSEWGLESWYEDRKENGG